MHSHPLNQLIFQGFPIFLSLIRCVVWQPLCTIKGENQAFSSV